jgi:myo-inositol catabolism protein IolC
MGAATRTWFVLAGDHRQPHLAALLGHADGPRDHATIAWAKATIAAGFEVALADGVDAAAAGLLIDEEFGADPARAAIAAGRNLAMPVESSGLDRFALADPGIVDRVLAIGPRWVKALVRYNVDGDAVANAESVAALTDLAIHLGTHGPGLMLEVVVPPTPRQLIDAGDRDAFARTRRPALAARAVTALLDAGLGPELWKVEGVDDADDAARLADAARAAERPAPLLVLGAAAAPARVDHWLRIAARTPGWAGFAVGRSLWWDPVRGLLAGRCDRDHTVAAIAASFRRAVDVYTHA